MTAAAQTVAKSATRDAHERLSKSGVPTDWDLKEIAAHLAAAVAGGYELPSEVLSVVDKIEHFAHLSATLIQPAEHRAADVSKLLNGASLAEIMDDDDKAARADSRWHRGSALLTAADAAAGRLAGEALRPIRDGLITGPLRDAVADVLGEARKLAPKLAAFAPDYGPQLLESATDKELAVWRQSRKLQSNFDLLLAAWHASWPAATGYGGGMERAFELLPSPLAVGWFVWVAPDDATRALDPETEILRIATAPSEYQLLAPSELDELVAKITAPLPDSPGPVPATGPNDPHVLLRLGTYGPAQRVRMGRTDGASRSDVPLMVRRSGG